MENTFEEYLDEEELLLSLLDLDDCLYFGLHPSNVVPMQGYLPEDKDTLIGGIGRKRKQLGKRLKERPRRSGEGAIV